MTGRPVPAVVREGDRLDQRQAEVGGPGDAGRDLGDLHGMREPGAEVVVGGGDEHLALAGQSPPLAGVLDAIQVALEAQPERVGFLRAGARPRTERPGRTGRERGCERRLGVPPCPTNPPPTHACAPSCAPRDALRLDRGLHHHVPIEAPG